MITSVIIQIEAEKHLLQLILFLNKNSLQNSKKGLYKRKLLIFFPYIFSYSVSTLGFVPLKSVLHKATKLSG